MLAGFWPGQSGFLLLCLYSSKHRVAPTHSRGCPPVTLFMINSTISRGSSDKSLFHMSMHCICTRVAQEKKKVSNFQKRRGIILYVSVTFSQWPGSKQKTEKVRKIFRMTVGFKTVIQNCHNFYVFLLPAQSSFKCKRNWFGQKMTAKTVISCSFYHKSLPLCWSTVSYSLPPPCPFSMRRNSCEWQALKNFSPRP